MQDRIDLAVGQETDRIAGSFLDPIDVPPGVKADLEQDRGEKEVVRRPLVLDRYRLALEVPPGYAPSRTAQSIRRGSPPA
jgi:hypothetical protein